VLKRTHSKRYREIVDALNHAERLECVRFSAALLSFVKASKTKTHVCAELNQVSTHSADAERGKPLRQNGSS